MVAELSPSLFRELFPLHDPWALIWDNEVLQIGNPRSKDYACFRETAASVLKYYKPQTGDALLFNDPLVTGGHLGEICIFICLQSPSNQERGCYLAVKRELVPLPPWSVDINKEGLRIPPTPLFSKFQLNRDLVEVISQHPLCPKNLRSFVSDLDSKLPILQRQFEFVRSQFNDSSVISYFQKNLKFEKAHVLERIGGNGKVEIPLLSGELLKLHLQFLNNAIRVDLSGSSEGKEIFFPAGLCQGLIYGFFKRYFDLPNHGFDGSRSLFELVLADGKFVSPHPQGRGSVLASRYGQGILATALDQAFLELHHKSIRQTNSHFPIWLRIHGQNSGERYLFAPCHQQTADSSLFDCWDNPLSGLDDIADGKLKILSAGGKKDSPLVYEFLVQENLEISYIGNPIDREKVKFPMSKTRELKVLRGSETFTLKGHGNFQLQKKDHLLIE